jgi:release factor glutamine methyltransferase
MLAWMTDDFRGRGIESPRLDGELILSDVLGIDRVRLYMDLERPLSDGELALVRERVQRRRGREPMAYIRGRREFFGRAFAVNRHVLIPRPETELVVERALLALPPGEDGLCVLDLCTGSGCIGVTVALERPLAKVTLTDVSREALVVAKQNTVALGAEDRVSLAEGDLFAAVDPAARFHVIASNPPYVRADEMAGLAADVRDHEPRLALEAGADGLDAVRRIVAEAPAFLRPGGRLIMEIGEEQSEQVLALAGDDGQYAERVVHRDLQGHPRVVELVRAT